MCIIEAQELMTAIVQLYLEDSSSETKGPPTSSKCCHFNAKLALIFETGQ